MKAYSEDLRERILWAVDQGHPRAEIVQRFGVSLSTVKRYLKLRRDEGHVRPKAIPGRTPKKRAQVQAGLETQLRAHADATLEQHCEMWEQAHGEPVSRWTMSRAIKQLGWTRKKTVWAKVTSKQQPSAPRVRKERLRVCDGNESASVAPAAQWWLRGGALTSGRDRAGRRARPVVAAWAHLAPTTRNRPHCAHSATDSCSSSCDR